MAKVTLQNVCKLYPGDHGEVLAVDHFNLEIKDREFVVFVGPSGCGKSTTLRMIAGLEEISRGDVMIGDTRVNDLPPKDRDIAMVFQNYALYPHMSVRDNLAFSLKIRKNPPPEINRRVDDASAILGIEPYLERKPKALSGGQRQRVAVGRAIVRQPKVFLFDEPLSNLDAKMRVQMRTEITKLHQRLQATMIYVTHDQVEAMTMGDRIVVMKDGVVQQVDAPMTIYRRPVNLFVAGFIGSPEMNLLSGTLVEGPQGLTFKEEGGIVECHLPHYRGARAYIGKPVIFGIRPENILIIDETHPLNPENTRFTGEVDIVEPMGAETHVYVQTGAHSLTARTPIHLGHDSQGKSLQFEIEAAKSHLFDPETTRRISEE